MLLPTGLLRKFRFVTTEADKRMNGVYPLFFRSASVCHVAGLPQGDVPVHSGEIELRVEMRQGGSWQGVDARTVFRNKDEIRFAFRSSFPGYLRVVNHSSDGQTAPLFPLADSKQPTAQVLANTDYFIPGQRDLLWWQASRASI